MRKIADIPPQDVLIRKEFLYNESRGHGEYVKGVAFGVRCVESEALAFCVLLENGAQWYRMPLHAIVKQPCEAWQPHDCQMWDCLSAEFTVHAFAFLKNMECDVYIHKKPHAGTYLFTIDYYGSYYADHPVEHKTHHVIELDDGHIVAYPNNRILWKSASWITHDGKPDYEPNEQLYFAERNIALKNPDRVFYEETTE